MEILAIQLQQFLYRMFPRILRTEYFPLNSPTICAFPSAKWICRTSIFSQQIATSCINLCIVHEITSAFCCISQKYSLQMSLGKIFLGVFWNGSNYSLDNYIIFATIYMQKKYKRITLHVCASKKRLSAAAIKKESKNHRNTRAANVLCCHDNCHFWSGELREKTLCRAKLELN